MHKPRSLTKEQFASPGRNSAVLRPDKAKAVASYLQGKAYRVCTTPNTGLDTDTMLSRCGQAR